MWIRSLLRILKNKNHGSTIAGKELNSFGALLMIPNLYSIVRKKYNRSFNFLENFKNNKESCCVLPYNLSVQLLQCYKHTLVQCGCGLCTVKNSNHKVRNEK